MLTIRGGNILQKEWKKERRKKIKEKEIFNAMAFTNYHSVVHDLFNSNVKNTRSWGFFYFVICVISLPTHSLRRTDNQGASMTTMGKKRQLCFAHLAPLVLGKIDSRAKERAGQRGTAKIGNAAILLTTCGNIADICYSPSPHLLSFLQRFGYLTLDLKNFLVSVCRSNSAG